MPNPPQSPHSIEAEQAVIGAVLIDPEILSRLPIVDADFYQLRHRIIWSSIRAIAARHQQVDYLTVSQEISNSDRDNLVGGPAYLTECIASVPTTSGAETYADTLRGMRRRRDTIEVARRLATSAFDLDSDLDAAIADGMTRLALTAVPADGCHPISEFASQLYDETELASKNPGDIYGIETGLKPWDRVTHGMQPGEMVILSGVPGLGKTLLATQLCVGMSATRPGAIFELEMRGVNICRRVVSSMTGITPAAMRSGYMSGKWEAFTSAIDELAQRPIYLSDRTDWNTVTFRAECARLKREYGIGWVMLDYLELLKDTYGKDANERGAFISDALHGVFKDLQLAGLVIDSMNKEGIASVTPAQHHVGGAARKIYNADAIVFISRNRQNKEVIDLTWGKNREGESDLTAQLYKPEGSLKFSEVSYAK